MNPTEVDDVVWVSPRRMGGDPCFRGTRVPVWLLVDHLKYGETIDSFLESCPTVTREQIEKFLDSVAQRVA